MRASGIGFGRRLLLSRPGMKIVPASRSTRSSVSVTASVKRRPTVPQKGTIRLTRSGSQEARPSSSSYSSAWPSCASTRIGSISKMPTSTCWPRDCAARSAALRNWSSLRAAVGATAARAAMWSSTWRRRSAGTGVLRSGSQGRTQSW